MGVPHQCRSGCELHLNVSFSIDPEVIDPEDAETLADLIVAAHADARRQIEAQQQSLMAEAAGPMAGMNIPGLKF